MQEKSTSRKFVPFSYGGGILYRCGNFTEWKWVPRRCFLNSTTNNGSNYILFRHIFKLSKNLTTDDSGWKIYGNQCHEQSFHICACESINKYLTTQTSKNLSDIITDLFGKDRTLCKGSGCPPTNFSSSEKNGKVGGDLKIPSKMSSIEKAFYDLLQNNQIRSDNATEEYSAQAYNLGYMIR
uniref:Uncharacterized protein n=1 Tax=Romanomermis culicivorax TaxID=13658 RepID=A0A915HIN1_ROMCU